MRKIFFTLAALAMLATSCSQHDWEVDQNVVVNETRTYTVAATMPQSTPNTRVSLEADGTTPHGIVMKWEENDVLKLCFEYNGGFFYNDAVIVPSSITGDGLTAVFTIDYPAEIGDNNFNVYGVYQKKGEGEQFNDKHASFEEGTKNFILSPYEESAITLDKNPLGDNQLMTHPMLYFSQENVNTIATINLQHSGWMIALHFKNSSSTPFFPDIINLHYDAYNTNKVWNGVHENFEVKFDVGDKKFSSNHLEDDDTWWGDATYPASFLQFDNSLYWDRFGDVNSNEEVIFYRWLVSETLDFSGFIGQMVYHEDEYSPGLNIEETYAGLPAKTVQVGNVYHIYSEWDGAEFKFVGPSPYAKEDFIGNFTMTGKAAFQNGENASMVVEIIDGENEHELLIKGVDFAKEIVATFDPSTSLISIKPQPLAYHNLYDITLETITTDGEGLVFSETAVIDLQRDVAGDLFVAKHSEAIGYALYSDVRGGYADGYYYLKFTRNASGQKASVNSDSGKALEAHSALTATPRIDNPRKLRIAN